MSWHTIQLLSLANFAICSGIGWACICRLNTEVCRRYPLARARYTLLLAGATASGLEPLLFGVRPGVGSVIFSGAVLVGLAINVVRWTGLEKFTQEGNHESD